MKYKEWNDTIAGHFFHPDHAGERVYLSVSDNLIRDIAEKNGIPRSEGIDAFVQATKEGHWVGKHYDVASAPVHWVKKVRNLWAEECSEDYPYPPYIGYLALYVLAAGYGSGNEFEPQAYYPRLNELLGRRAEAGPPEKFEDTVEVWRDLERWTAIEKKGKLGIFEIQYLDKRTIVGIPFSQSVLSQYERRVARWVYSQTGLDPALMPSEEEVASIVARRGGSKLRPRTRKLLRRGDSYPRYRQAIIDALLEVLQSWDGTLVELEDEHQEGETPLSGSLAPSLRDRFGEVSFRLRCVSPRDFPEGEIVLQDEENVEYTCHEIAGGWSTALRYRDGGELEATSLDWSSTVVLEDPDQEWRFRLRPSEVRVFIRGQDRGIPGINDYVDTGRLPLETPFYLLARASEAETIEDWGASSCENFTRVSGSGLPEEWRLYRSDGAQDDKGVHSQYNVLTQPRDISVGLEGGVRVRPGTSEYFTFAPPAVRVRGGEPVEVRCEDKILEKSKGGKYELPESLQSPGEREVSISQDGDIIKRKLFALYDHSKWRDVPGVQHDKFGSVWQAGDNEPTSWYSPEKHDPDSTPLNFFPGLLDIDAQAVYLVGSTPGEVVKWPEESPPADWQGVWAVPKDGRALYCWPGEPVPPPQPVPDLNRPGGPEYPSSKINKWKEVLFHLRKKVTPPRNHRVAWEKYQEHAAQKC
jgi:hypothetical protein